MISKKKRCGSCKIPKLLKEFNKDRSKKDGLADVCRECNKEHSKRFRNNPNNKERLKKGFKKYEQSEKGKITRAKVIKKRSKIPKTALQKLIHSTRCRIAQGIKIAQTTKSNKSVKLIGCSWIELKDHLEKQFKEGMSWENYGKKGWTVDHKKPLISFNLSDPEQQKECFHYTNLQPLWAIENSKKGGKEC